MIQNVQAALEFVKSQRVKLVNISSEGFLFFLFLVQKKQLALLPLVVTFTNKGSSSLLNFLDIVDKNLKLILGLIWTIIQRFQIEDISEEGITIVFVL